MLLLILASLLASSSARPSFLAIPADQIAFLDLSRGHVRVPRQALTPPPLPPALPLTYRNVPHQGQHLPPDVAGIEQLPQHPQQLQQYRPNPVQHNQHIFSDAIREASGKVERPLDFGEYVDFGAHTGDHGAFGWYADYPVSQVDINSY